MSYTGNEPKFVTQLPAENSTKAATTAYVDAESALKADAVHTHPLSDLTQSGATSGQVPEWDGAAWVPATPSGGGANVVAVIDQFVGTGAQTLFTLSVTPAAVGNLDVYIQGVRQESSEYSLLGADLTFTTAPANALTIEVKIYNILGDGVFLNSPAFTGVPTAPTATIGTNTTQLATTAYVTAAVAGGGGGGPDLAFFVKTGVMSWGNRPGPLDLTYVSCVYGNDIFVAVSQTTTATPNKIMTSPNGNVWTARVTPTNTFTSVTFGNGLFVAVAENGTLNRIMTSPNGIVWTSRTTPVDISYKGITFGNGLFVAVAWSGTGNRVMTSPDGIVWTVRTSAADNAWRAVTYGNGLFVAVASTGTGNRVMTSPDGIVWTSRNAAVDNNWHAVTYGNGLFVAVAQSGTGNRVMTSPDGIVWTSRTSAADNAWAGIAFGEGIFCACSWSSGSTAQRIMTSTDGIEWEAQHTPFLGTGDLFAIAYGKGTFVAVAASVGAANKVMISTPYAIL
jgi:hypothetical protein